MIDPPRNEDDVRKIVQDNGIEFLFAQFVDMHGKPSAKLVPAHHLDDLLTEGAGFAGFARLSATTASFSATRRSISAKSFATVISSSS